MIAAHNTYHLHEISFSPGWIVFIAWLKDNGITLDQVKRCIKNDPKEFLLTFKEFVNEADQEFYDYTNGKEEIEEDISSYLFSLIAEKNN